MTKLIQQQQVMRSEKETQKDAVVASSEASDDASQSSASTAVENEHSLPQLKPVEAKLGLQEPSHDIKKKNASFQGFLHFIQRWSIVLVWPGMWTVPLLLSSPYSPTNYKDIFPPSWYDNTEGRKHPLGLCLGITAVAVGQLWVWIFFYIYKYGFSSNVKQSISSPLAVQIKGARFYDFVEGLTTHLAQPEGFGLLATYLTVTWMLSMLPSSYYSFQGTIQWKEALICLIVQDALQFIMHLLEHVVSPTFYQYSHKPHHYFTNPRLFDAFNGSTFDTIAMILIPLFSTAQIVRNCNVWTYMTFGSTYACWLTLIHSEYALPWDRPVFRRLGLGTPADHHVHHKLFKYNYGHLFMWWDKLFKTYRDPKIYAPKVFAHGV